MPTQSGPPGLGSALGARTDALDYDPRIKAAYEAALAHKRSE